MEFVYTLGHYLYPRYSNNHKAKILHSSSLFLLSAFLIFYQVILHILPTAGVKVLGYAANIDPSEIIRLTNEKRKEQGEEPLVYSSVLTEAARQKGAHMLEKDYWAHTAPDGTEPWKFFSDVGYKYRYAGENLARDFSNPSSAVDAWMASPSHRENMFSGKYKEIGVAVVEGDLAGVDTTIIVQLFGTKLVDNSASVPIVQAKPPSASAPAETTSSLSSTPTPTIVPSQGIVVFAEPAQKENNIKVLVSPFETTRGVSIATTILLLIILVIDGVVVARRKIPRVGGRTFAHLAFLGMILAIIIIAKAGSIL